MQRDVINTVTLGNDEKSLAVFHQMLKDMRAGDQPLGSLDFNKLIPMPEPLNIDYGTTTIRGLKLYRQYARESARIIKIGTKLPSEQQKELFAAHTEKWLARKREDPEAWALGEQAYNNIQLYGEPTWFDWCRRNWGSTLNAYRCQPLQEDSNTMVFHTAWGGVPKIIELLSRKYPEQTVTYQWAAEAIGRDVGTMVFKAGETLDAYIPREYSREAYEMAAAIMGEKLSNYNLFLTKDKSTYEYHDPPRKQRTRSTKKTKANEFDR